MVSFVTHVEHGRCGLCRKAAPLFTLHARHAGFEIPDGFPIKREDLRWPSVVAQVEAYLAPAPADTHEGICEECWQRIGVILLNGPVPENKGPAASATLPPKEVMPIFNPRELPTMDQAR